MRRLVYVATTSVLWTVTFASPALATLTPPISVPEPTTLSLLSGGVALAVLGARWLRRK